MGNSLHNKIYLGRHSLLASRRLWLGMAAGGCVTVALVWLMVRALH